MAKICDIGCMVDKDTPALAVKTLEKCGHNICVECVKDMEEDPKLTCAACPYWQCESCNYVDTDKPMPPDRAKFYEVVDRKGSPKCPHCKSETFMPVGY